MNEDTTKQLPDSLPFEERVLSLFDRVFAELAAVRAEVRDVRERQEVLEEKVDRRLQETRPIWEAVLQEVRANGEEIETVKRTVNQVDNKFDTIVEELFEQKIDMRDFKKRLARLESSSPA